jgi:hypothetical protein
LLILVSAVADLKVAQPVEESDSSQGVLTGRDWGAKGALRCRVLRTQTNPVVRPPIIYCYPTDHYIVAQYCVTEFCHSN